MPTTYPDAFDVPANPSLNTSMAGSGFEHDLQHVNINDMMKAVQRKVGLTNSPDTTSITNQVNTAGANITILQGSVSTLNSQLGITNANVTANTNTIAGQTTSINNLTATKLNLSGGKMTGQLFVQYNAPAISASSYVTAQVFISNTASPDNPPQLGFQATGALGMTLYLNASGLNAITNLGGSSLIVNSQGQLNPLSFADGSLPAAKLIPATVNTAQLANNSVTKPIIAAGAIDASKFDSSVMAAIQTAVGCPSGTITPFVGIVLPPGWLACNGQAVSRATYATLWGLCSTAYGPGDGSTTFNLPDLRSRVPLGAYWDGAAWTAPAGLTARSSGQTGGEERHTLTVAEMPSHTHTVSDPGHAHGITQSAHAHSVSDPTHAHSVSDPSHRHQEQGAGGIFGAQAGGATMYNFATIYTSYAATGIGIYAAATGIGIYGNNANITINSAGTGISIAASGSGTAHNVMPPYQVIGMYIIKY